MNKYGKYAGHMHTAGGKTPTYNSWANMMSRCNIKSSPSFFHYKKRGITMCERWKDFANFLDDMGVRPDGNYTLDRIDNNGNYEPGNVRWATKREQANNRVTNIFFYYLDVKYTLADLARKTGVSKELLRCRLVRNKGHRKWTVDQAINEPPKKGKRYDLK